MKKTVSITNAHITEINIRPSEVVKLERSIFHTFILNADKPPYLRRIPTSDSVRSIERK